MKHTWLGILLACCVVNAAFAGGLDAGSLSTVSSGKYAPEDKRLLPLAFMTSVYSWLHRYGPEQVSRDAEHVKMKVNYDYMFDVELTIKPDTYEIKVTLTERLMTKTAAPNVQKDAEKIALGVHRMMEGEIERSGH